MSTQKVNTSRLEPYKNYMFRMKELDGSGNVLVIQTMTLKNEGWERDTSSAEPAEPSFNLPEITS
jgi:hypothetical protein